MLTLIIILIALSVPFFILLLEGKINKRNILIALILDIFFMLILNAAVYALLV